MKLTCCFRKNYENIGEFDFLVNIIRMKLTCFEVLKSENIGV